MKHPSSNRLEVELASACATTQHAAIIMAQRDRIGVERYGQNVDDKLLTASEWALHAVEELADGLKYAIRAQEEAEKLEMEIHALRTANAALAQQVKRLEAAGDKLIDAIHSVQCWSGTYVGECADEFESAKGNP